MGTIPDEILQRVRDAHDIVEVVGRSLELKKAGSAWKACCPFHDEKTPSFQVNPRLQIFKCFGCGKGGNVFHWLVEREGLSFREAVERLAGERGIEVPRGGPSTPGPSPDARREIARVLDWAHRWYRQRLATADGEEARAYLARRGYGPQELERFGLGLAPAQWDALVEAARKRGVDGARLAAAGLAKARERERGGGWYDTFRHRIVFPIHDAQGALVTFAGRALDPDDPAKYINGPETATFQKGRVLYGLDAARDALRKTPEAVLVEGYTDVLMCRVHGFDRAVAGMGTALGDGQARLLKRFADRVVLLYDGDPAGRAAAERAVDVLLPAGLGVRVADLPAGRDVDEILAEEGREALERLLAGAPDWFDHRLGLEAARHDLSTAAGRARASEAILPSVMRLPSEIERQQRLKVLAERLGGDLADVGAERALRQMAGRHAQRRPPRAAPRGAPPAPPVRPDHDRRRVGLDVVAATLVGGRLGELVVRALGPEDVPPGPLRRLYEAALDAHERGEAPDRESLAAALPADAEALAALADLPADPGLVERVEAHVAFLERRRRQEEVAARLAEQLRAAAAGRTPRANDDRPSTSFHDDGLPEPTP